MFDHVIFPQRFYCPDTFRNRLSGLRCFISNRQLGEIKPRPPNLILCCKMWGKPLLSLPHGALSWCLSQGKVLGCLVVPAMFGGATWHCSQRVVRVCFQVYAFASNAAQLLFHQSHWHGHGPRTSPERISKFSAQLGPAQDVSEDALYAWGFPHSQAAGLSWLTLLQWLTLRWKVLAASAFWAARIYNWPTPYAGS